MKNFLIASHREMHLKCKSKHIFAFVLGMGMCFFSEGRSAKTTLLQKDLTILGENQGGGSMQEVPVRLQNED